jgi:hypothetical protein
MTRRSLSFLPIAGMLLLTACPQMTTSPMGAPNSPLSAGGEDKTASDKTSSSGDDTLSPPPAAVPEAPTPGGGGDPGGIGGEGPGGMEFASRDGSIFSAPSGPEPVEEPEFLLNCNIHLLRLVPTARWRNAEEFLAWLRTATTASGDVLGQFLGGCDLQIIVEGAPESQVKDRYAADLAHADSPMYMGPGRYLIFRSVAEFFPNPEEFVSFSKTFANLEELKAFASDPAKVRFIGDTFVAPMPIRIDPTLLLPTPLPGPGLPQIEFAPFLR